MSEDLQYKNPVYGVFFGVVGCSMSMILSSAGAIYGTLKSGTSISCGSVFKPDIIMRSLIPVVMASIISIYGLVASVLIADAIQASVDGYTTYLGYLHLSAGLSVGFSGLAAGYAIGEVGAAGIIATVHEPSVYLGIMLVLIFAEVLGLYGLIVALILTSKDV